MTDPKANTDVNGRGALGEAYVRGEIDRPTYLARIAELHAKQGHCVCMACVEVRNTKAGA